MKAQVAPETVETAPTVVKRPTGETPSEKPIAVDLAIPLRPTEAESAMRAFNRFNPPRPMTDLSQADWLALGILYSTDIQRGNDGKKEWENRYLILRFIPDYRPPAPYSLLMLLYGYQRIYGYRSVSAHYLEEGLFRSGLRAPITPLESLTLSIFDDRRLNVDDVAKAHVIDGLISEKTGLAKGGYYSLTERGMKKAEEMFADLVRRA